jgi:hypothetical protein
LVFGAAVPRPRPRRHVALLVVVVAGVARLGLFPFFGDERRRRWFRVSHLCQDCDSNRVSRHSKRWPARRNNWQKWANHLLDTLDHRMAIGLARITVRNTIDKRLAQL